MPTTAQQIESSGTADVLRAMLTENTGQHMLDSGGAYGRNWERNQGEDFGSHPDVNVEWGIYPRPGATWPGARDKKPELECNVTLDVYHFLLARLEFLPEHQAELDRLADENPDESWLGLAELWAVQFCEREGGDHGTVNTYNHESMLSQVLQYTYVEDPEDSSCLIVALSIHGGCDVRGGYTAPKMFRTWNWELMDDGKFEVACSNPHCEDRWGQPTRWEYQGGYHPWYSEDDKDLADYPVARHQPDGGPRWLRWPTGNDFGLKGVIVVDEDGKRASCPVCGEGELKVYPPYAE